MKTLKESILKSVRAGKYGLAEQWCKDHNIFNGNFEILSNGKIRRKGPESLVLAFNDYTEIPDSIEFADDPGLYIIIGDPQNFSNIDYIKITNFNKLPKKCRCLNIIENIERLPQLDICVEEVNVYGKIKEIDGLRINFSSGRKKFTFNYLTEKQLKNVYITGVAYIDFRSNVDANKTFTKGLRKYKAEYNKFNKETPISEECEKFIKDFFGKNIDLSHTLDIVYGKIYMLKQIKEKWYKVKNPYGSLW
jgi:hypothetical protein